MSGFVYFIGDPTSVWVKIGYARDVEKRRLQLLCGTHEEIETLAAVPSHRLGEGALHKALTGPRRREWFLKDAAVKFALYLALDGTPIDVIVQKLENYYRAERQTTRELRIARLERTIADPETPDDIRPVYQRLREQAVAAAGAA